MRDLSSVVTWRSLPNIEKGKLGEQLAIDWLKGYAFEIVATNFRTGRFEMDIVAARTSCLYGVEVKLRFNNNYGDAEEHLSAVKIAQMKWVGEALLEQYPHYSGIELFMLNIFIKHNNIQFRWAEIL